MSRRNTLRAGGLRTVAGVALLALVIAACGEADEEPVEEPAAEEEAEESEEPEPDEAEEEEPAAQEDDEWAAVVAAAEEEGVVFLRSTFNEQLEPDLFAVFEEETGIRVEYARLGGTGPSVQQYLTEVEAGQQLVDVMQLTADGAQNLVDLGHIAEVDLPAIEQIAEPFRFPDSSLTPTAVAGLPIVYNNTLIGPDELPNSYAELADPEYNGMIAMGSPENSGQALRIGYLMIEQEGEEWLDRFAANDILETDREVEAAELIARGERVFGAMTMTSPASQITEGAPISLHWFDNVIVGPYAAVIPEEAPNPNAARVFVNWMIEEGHQQRFAEALGIYPVREGVELGGDFPVLTDLDPVSIPIPDLIEQRQATIDAWRAALG
jgi:iron(III) transport system substrate-binding protein